MLLEGEGGRDDFCINLHNLYDLLTFSNTTIPNWWCNTISHVNLISSILFLITIIYNIPFGFITENRVCIKPFFITFHKANLLMSTRFIKRSEFGHLAYITKPCTGNRRRRRDSTHGKRFWIKSEGGSLFFLYTSIASLLPLDVINLQSILKTRIYIYSSSICSYQ